jgi:hypothetical protein
MEQPVRDFHARLTAATKKPGLRVGRPGFAVYDLRLRILDQPRVRERIMKLSKVYSATCHHRYSSER